MQFVPRNKEGLETLRLIVEGVVFDDYRDIDKKWEGITVKNRDLTPENIKAIERAGYKKSDVQGPLESQIFIIEKKILEKNWADSPYSRLKE